MEDGERVWRILSQHLGLEPAREVSTEIVDIERELAEAGCLRRYTKEDVDITLGELMREIEETSSKMDENLKK